MVNNHITAITNPLVFGLKNLSKNLPKRKINKHNKTTNKKDLQILKQLN